MTQVAGKPHAFHTLDILRGFAAVVVIIFHFGLSGSGTLGISIFPHGYLAVDFFFVLSGFVLAYAYQEKLDRGWSTSSFFLVRIIRLYPLYFVGLSLGFLFIVLENFFGSHHHVPATTILLTFTTSLLLIPAFGLGQQPDGTAVYPFNRPAWSLFFEIVANVFHASVLRRRSSKFLAGTLVFTGAALVYSCLKFGSIDFGTDRSEVLYGLPRVLFPYTLGIVLLRVWKAGRGRLDVPPVVIAIVLLLALEVPLAGRFTVFYDLAVTFLLFPVMVLAGAWSQPGPRFMKATEWMGAASYAVYVVHRPLSLFVGELTRRVTHHDPAFYAPWPGIACVVLAVVVALLLDKYYDPPARAFLRKRLLREAQPPSRAKVVL